MKIDLNRRNSLRIDLGRGIPACGNSTGARYTAFSALDWWTLQTAMIRG